MSTKQTTRAAGESVAFLAILGGILVVANILATSFNLGRADLTHNRVYSLSPGSENVVSHLDDTLTVRVYFTDDLPAEFASTERQVRDLLSEYRAASRGKMVVRFIRPDNEDRQERAERDGVQKVQHNVLRNDERIQVDGYRGLAMEYRGETKAIPVIEGSAGLEYRLTMLIREMTQPKRKIGVVTGHGHTATTAGFQNLAPLLPSYELVDVDATQTIDTNIRALLLVGPDSPLTEPELRNIDAYVMNGGSLGVYGGTVKLPNPEQPAQTAETVDSGVNRLLDRWGAHIETDLLVDARSVPRQSQSGAPEQYPMWDLVLFEESAHSHPAAYQLNETLLAWSSTVTRRAHPSNVHVTVLAKSSPQSWRLRQTPIPIEPSAGGWDALIAPAPRGPFNLLVAIDGRLPSAFAPTASTDAASEQAASSGPSVSRVPTRVLVAGSSSLISEMFVPPQQAFQNPQTAARAQQIVTFTLNSIDWLANDNDLIAIRAKSIDAPMLDIQHDLDRIAAEARPTGPIENETDLARAQARIRDAQERIDRMRSNFENKKRWYKWGVPTALPVLVLIFAGLRFWLRSRHRANLAG